MRAVDRKLSRLRRCVEMKLGSDRPHLVDRRETMIHCCLRWGCCHRLRQRWGRRQFVGQGGHVEVLLLDQSCVEEAAAAVAAVEAAVGSSCLTFKFSGYCMQ